MAAKTKHPQGVEYIHIRYPSEDDELELSGKGGATIAYRPTPDNEGVEFGIAICSDRDNYCKRIGRDISLGRLLSGDREILPITGPRTVVRQELINYFYEVV